MTLPVEFGPHARAELLEGIRFYRERGGNLGAEFLAEVRRASAQVSEMPSTGTPDALGVRRTLLRRFPYSVIYRVEAERVYVLALMHQRRNPGYWQDRL